MWPDLWKVTRDPLPEPPGAIVAPAGPDSPVPGVDRTGWRWAARGSREARA